MSAPVAELDSRNETERIDTGLAVLDARLRIVCHDPGFARHCGPVGTDLSKRSISELFHPSTRQTLQRRLGDQIAGGAARISLQAAPMWAGSSEAAGFLTGLAVRSRHGLLTTVAVAAGVGEGSGASEASTEAGVTVTPIDAHILEGVAAGVPTARLAPQLNLSHQGVEYRIGKLMREFEVPNRSALISRAYSTGLFDLQSWPPEVLPVRIRLR